MSAWRDALMAAQDDMAAAFADGRMDDHYAALARYNALLGQLLSE